MTTTTSTHSVPPQVDLSAAGRDMDIPVITLDLEGGAIANSITRRLATSLSRAKRTFLLQAIAAETPAGQDTLIADVLGMARPYGVFQVDLDRDAAQALLEALTLALNDADTECHTDGCGAVGLIDGYCAADSIRLDRRIGGAA